MEMTAEQEYAYEQIEPVLGGKVTSMAVDRSGMWGLEVVKNRKKFVVWVLQDEEGNGPGTVDVVAQQKEA